MRFGGFSVSCESRQKNEKERADQELSKSMQLDGGKTAWCVVIEMSSKIISLL